MDKIAQAIETVGMSYIQYRYVSLAVLAVFLTIIGICALYGLYRLARE